MVLVIDDEDEPHKHVAEAFCDLPWRLRSARSGEEAREAIAEERAADVVLVLVDLDLGHGVNEGLDLIIAAQLFYPQALRASITVSIDPRLINAVGRVGASFISKHSEFVVTLRALVPSVMVAKVIPEGALRRAVDTLVRRSELTARETEILVLAVDGHSPEQIWALLAMAQNTYKKHVGHILRKTGFDSLLAIVIYLLRSP